MIASAAVAALCAASPAVEPPARLPARVRRLVVHALGGPSYSDPRRRFVFFTPPQTQALWRSSFGAHWIVWTDGSLWPRHGASWRPAVDDPATLADRRRLAREAAPVYSHVRGANTATLGIELAHSGRSGDALPGRPGAEPGLAAARARGHVGRAAGLRRRRRSQGPRPAARLRAVRLRAGGLSGVRRPRGAAVPPACGSARVALRPPGRRRRPRAPSARRRLRAAARRGDGAGGPAHRLPRPVDGALRSARLPDAGGHGGSARRSARQGARGAGSTSLRMRAVPVAAAVGGRRPPGSARGADGDDRRRRGDAAPLAQRRARGRGPVPGDRRPRRRRDVAARAPSRPRARPRR